MSGTIYFRGPVGSMEGPRLVSNTMGVNSCFLRVPWYGFCCLECKNIAYIVDFLWWAIWPPPCLIKDSETPVWWGLMMIGYGWLELTGLANTSDLQYRAIWYNMSYQIFLTYLRYLRYGWNIGDILKIWDIWSIRYLYDTWNLWDTWGIWDNKDMWDTTYKLQNSIPASFTFKLAA